MAEFCFESAPYRWEARVDADWYFAEVPPDMSAQIAELQHPLPRRGFGGVRVEATVGSTTWRTSIFPSRDGTYSLPLKQSVRATEGLVEEEPFAVHLRILDV